MIYCKEMEEQKQQKNLWIVLAYYIMLSYPSLLSAQIDFRPGYVVRNGGDTVKGFVAYRTNIKNVERCTFRESRKGAIINYTAADIDGFGIFGDRNYQSVDFPRGAPVKGRGFVKVVVRGSFNLYKAKNFYLVKGKDSLVVLPIPKDKMLDTLRDLLLKKDRRYIGVLIYMMQDCQIDVADLGYAEGPLSQLVYKYNQCLGKGPTTRSLLPMARVGFSVFAGYVHSNLNYDFNYVIPFKGNNVIGGVGIDISSPRVFDKFYVSIEALYSQSLYQGYYEGISASYPVKYDVFAEFTSLKIPLGIKYNFRNAGNMPYLRIGLFWTFTQHSLVRTVEEKETPAAILTYEYTTGYQFKNPKGYWASIGYDRTLYKRTRIFTEFRYEIGEGYIGTLVVNESQLTSYNFLMGLRF